MPDLPSNRRVIFQGRKIDLALQTITLADGSKQEYEVVLHPGAVALVPMVSPDQVCLVHNKRYAAGERLIEVPAGTLNPGEDPATTAARELAEETGYRAGKITPLSWWWVSPGVLSERMHLFLCEDLRSGPTDLELDEDLEPLVVPWQEAMAMVHDGRIHDAKSMLALLLVDRLRSSR